MESLGDGYFSASLSDTTNQIEEILNESREKTGLMIYWKHGHNIFMFFYPGDQMYRVEMRRLRRELRKQDGNVLEIVAGEPLQVGCDTLYPIEVKMSGLPCAPYLLLREDGMIEHLDYTPYFVRTIQKRDEILQWLNE
jgi:hypothetical protein